MTFTQREFIGNGGLFAKYINERVDMYLEILSLDDEE